MHWIVLCCSLSPHTQDERTLQPLTYGCIASYYYLHHTTVRLFRERLQPNSSLEDLLKMISVRRNKAPSHSSITENLMLEIPFKNFALSYWYFQIICNCI